jgi:hypothetical protein
MLDSWESESIFVVPPLLEMSSTLNLKLRQPTRGVTHSSVVLESAVKGWHDGSALGSSSLTIGMAGEQRKGIHNGKGFSW